MPVDVASAIPVKRTGQEPGSTVPVKILGACAVLLMATMLYNSIGGWHAQSHGQRSVQPAALPLQRRMRKSRFARQDDADSPSEVMVELSTPSPSPSPSSNPDPALAQPSLPTLSAPSPPCAQLPEPQVMVEELVTRDGKGMGKGRGGRGKGKGKGRGGGGLAAIFANQPASLRVQTPKGLVFAVPPPPPSPPPGTAPTTSSPNVTADAQMASLVAPLQRRVDAPPPNAGRPTNATAT